MSFTYLRNGETLTLEAARCGGCRMCTQVCPHGVFSMEGKTAAIVHRERCMECGACALNCPSGALTVRAGVGCAAAVIGGLLHKREPTCGCSDAGSSCDSGATDAASPCCKS